MKMKTNSQIAGYPLVLVLAGICFHIPTSYSARILGIFTIEAISHYKFHESMMKSLLDSGHQVTIIAPIKSKMAHENFTEIIYLKKEHDNNPIASLVVKKMPWFSMILTGMDITEEDCRRSISTADLKDIQRVDVIFIEMLPMWRCYLPLARKFNAPIIGTTPIFSWSTAEITVGIPRLASISLTEGYYIEPNANFHERLWRFFYEIENNIMLYLETLKTRTLYKELFPDQDVANRNVSLLFVNNHASLMPRLSVPNAISIGGINVKAAKLNPLPKHLQLFLDDGKEGVILFSLGSIIPEVVLNPRVKAAIIQTFKRIPHRVIWKFNNQVDGLPNNVLLSNWLPQKEILAHKNVVAFISHCGINSLYEAIYFGKPLILLPFFADQPTNAALLNSLEVGKYINVDELSEDTLLAALNEVINGTKYRQRITELSQKFKDDPMSPEELVVYWTEYVIRHKGAPHLRFIGADMPLYKYYLVDVIAFIFITFVIIVIATIILVKLVFVQITKLIRRKFKTKMKKDE